jgi:hypothetical protein
MQERFAGPAPAVTMPSGHDSRSGAALFDSQTIGYREHQAIN